MAGLGTHHFARFARTEPGLRKAIVRATLEILVVEALLRTTSLRRTCRILGIDVGAHGARVPAAPQVSSQSVATDGTSAELIELSSADQRALTKVARNWPFGGSCLRYSLALGWRLRRRRPKLALGVRAGRATTLNAHAWLEIGTLRVDFAGDDHPRLTSFVPLRAAQTDAP